MSICIYLDESGDLGWKLDLPYGQGGSSRYLTIASVVAPDGKSKLVGREIRSLYQKNGWNPKFERKWAEMSLPERRCFAESAANLVRLNPDIRFHAIVVRKENVLPALRREPNLLYNYMLNLSLIDEMAKYRQVTLVPDPRSIKIRSGNSMHEYLQLSLWYDKQVQTVLSTQPSDSKVTPNLQFADMLAGTVQSHFELGRSDPWKILAPRITLKRLFFERRERRQQAQPV